MILVDSSALIEYLRASGSAVDLRVDELIAAGEAITRSEPIEMELLRGARSPAEHRRLRSFLNLFALLPFDAATDFVGAARIFRLCRAAGVTPRSMIDCMIASVAMRHRAAVLAQGTDFARIASVVALDLDPATPTA